MPAIRRVLESMSRTVGAQRDMPRRNRRSLRTTPASTTGQPPARRWSRRWRRPHASDARASPAVRRASLVSMRGRSGHHRCAERAPSGSRARGPRDRPPSGHAHPTVVGRTASARPQTPGDSPVAGSEPRAAVRVSRGRPGATRHSDATRRVQHRRRVPRTEVAQALSLSGESWSWCFRITATSAQGG